jgi:Uma2 family endonuclease
MLLIFINLGFFVTVGARRIAQTDKPLAPLNLGQFYQISYADSQPVNDKRASPSYDRNVMATVVRESAPLESPTTGVPHKKFTAAEVDRMLGLGLFEGQRFELIEGDLIDKMGQNPPHEFVLTLFLEYLVALFGARRVRCQCSIDAAAGDRDRTRPEPAFAALREPGPYYSRRPRGDELLLAVEISDTTLAFDRFVKASIYARAGVPEYWVVDLNARAIFVHTTPVDGAYREINRFADHETIAPAGLQTSSILVSELLPPPAPAQ